MTTVDAHVLDQATWASLTGPHAHFAQGTGQALRYPPDVSPLTGVPPVQDAQVWADLHALVGPSGLAELSADLSEPPDGWSVERRGEGVQLVATPELRSGPAEGLVVLGTADVPDMVDLVSRTRPGPFESGTFRLGTYLGVRRAGALVAMAGERVRPPGWTEISAVCTDPAFRGQGLASRLVRAVAHGIRERGETPFIHAAATNTAAIRLYLSMGFALRRTRALHVLRAPAHRAPR